MDPAAGTHPGLDAENDDFSAIEDLIENGDVDGVAAIFARNDAAAMSTQQDVLYSISYLVLAVWSGSIEMLELVYTSCRKHPVDLSYNNRNSGASPLIVAVYQGRADIVRWCFSDGRLTPDSSLYGYYSGRHIEDAWRENPATFQVLAECTSYTALAREYAKCLASGHHNAEFAAWLSERAPLAGVPAGDGGV